MGNVSQLGAAIQAMGCALIMGGIAITALGMFAIFAFILVL